jgi:hypothetical protein
MASNGDQGGVRDPNSLPVRFPRGTTFTFKPTQYRRLVETLRSFGVYEQALQALEANGVTIVLRRNQADGVATAIAQIQKELTGSPLYDFARRFTRLAEPTDNVAETEGCPIGKFLVE